MTAVFLKLLNMSIAASWLVLAVILIRFFLKKAPSWIVCLLWGIVALRLVMPFTFESDFSLIPSAEVIPLDVTVSQTPAIYSGIPAVNSAVNPLVTQRFSTHAGGLETVVQVAAIVWLAGVAVMLVYSAVTYLKLRQQVAASIPGENRMYICDQVRSPFLLGIVQPRIYVPSGVDAAQLRFVLAHENAHLKRHDHWWKPLGFLLLTVYWFNPLLWAAYIYLCRDIERACDEKVIAGKDPAWKVGYSQALAACSVHRRMVMACPVAFGEVSVKERIKGVLSYKKPAIWIVCASVLVCVVTAACFLTNPHVCIHDYAGRITTEPTCTETGLQTRVCSHCQHSYTVLVDRTAHIYNAGVVTEAPSCTHEGVKLQECVGCGNQKTEMIRKTAHVAGQPTYVQEADCIHEGSRSATCSLCNEVYVTQVLPVNHNHDLQETVLREATCEEPGEGVLNCSRCGYSESVDYERLPHNYMVVASGEATCRSFGYTMRECVDCGGQHYEQTGLVGHNWEYYSSSKKCTYCGWSVPSDGASIGTNPFGTGTSQVSPQPSLPVVQWDPSPSLPSVGWTSNLW